MIQTAADIAAQTGAVPAGGGQNVTPLANVPLPAAQLPPATQPAVQLPPAAQPAVQLPPAYTPPALSVTPAAPAEPDVVGILGKIVDRLDAYETKTNQATEEQGLFNVLNPAGGTKADFDAFAAWGQTGMTAQQRAGLDATLANGTPQDKINMLGAYKAVMDAQNAVPNAPGVTANLPGTPQQGDPQGFISAAEFETIMQSEKFLTDPTYAEAMKNQRLMSRSKYGQ